MRSSLLVLSLLAAACSSPAGTYVTPAELAAMERAAEENGQTGGPSSMDIDAPRMADSARSSLPIVMPGDEALDPVEAEKKAEKMEERLLKLERRRQDLDRARPALDTRRASLMLDHESQLASEAITIAKAEREQRIALEDLTHYVEVEQVRRMAEDRLSVQSSADRLLETREELAQLEMMYGDSGLGDATAEIVLNRTRRRLTRAEESHRLREERSAELITISIPREIEKHEMAVRAAQVELENARRKVERGQLDRAAAVAKLAKDQIGLDREAEDIVREAEKIDREMAHASPSRDAGRPSLALAGTGR